MVDEHGLPVKLLLTAGHASDKATAPALLEGLPTSQAVIADRGYDWQHLVELVASRGGTAHIPTQRDRKQQRTVDRELYRQRNLIERFFNKLKHFRAIATRYDKRDDNFMASIQLASIRIWLRSNESVS